MCPKDFIFVRYGCVMVLCLLQATVIRSQDYDVSDIQCTFSNSGEGGSHARDSVMARLRKPDGFRGAPLFADDRNVDPLKDPSCQIRPDTSDTAELTYDLLVTDFTRCGVLKRNGFVHVRVWFPQFNGVVMMSDQELIIMCKPPESTIIQNKAAGFAGSFPQGARVSGVVEETPGRLEYEVALYKEAAPSRTAINHSKSELPVDQAVPIGTKLQLRARINPESAWKYVKLMEVTVSPDPDEPHSSGSVALVKDGCRNRDFATIIPHQPARYRDKPNEVFLDFEAFLLSTMKERSTLWIHSQIKACMDPTDCQPEYCLDLFEPAGHGRRRRTLYSSEIRNVTHRVGRNKKLPNAEAVAVVTNDTTQYAKFKENIEYTVIMPGDLYHNGSGSDAACSTFLMLAVVLGSLLFVSAFFMCYLASRLHVAVTLRHHTKSIDQLVREQTRNYGADRDKVEYTGRNTVQ